MKFSKTAVQCIAIIMLAFALRLFVYGLYQIPTGSMETSLLVGEVLVGDKLSLWWSAPQRGDIIVCSDPLYRYSDNILCRFFERYIGGAGSITKRVVGIPGDQIKGVIEDGKPVVYVNSKRYDEAYINRYPLILVDESLSSEYLDMKSTDTGEFRSYDPHKPYQSQPFYTIHEDMIVHTHNGAPLIRIPDASVAPREGQKLHDAVDYWDGSDIFNVTLKARQYWLMGDSRRNSLDSREFGPVTQSQIQAIIWFRIFSIDTGFLWRDIMSAPWKLMHYIRWQRCFTYMPSYRTTVKEE